MFKTVLKIFMLWACAASCFAYQNTGYTGVDDSLTMGDKIGMGLIFLAGICAVGTGIYKLIDEQKSGKAVALTLIVVGILAFGILGLWITKMSGFSF